MREANSRRRLQRRGRTERAKRGQASLGEGHIVGSTRDECGLQAKWDFVFELKSTHLLLPKGTDVSGRTECRRRRLIWEGLTGRFLCRQDRKDRRARGLSFQAFPDTHNDGEGDTKSSYQWESSGPSLASGLVMLRLVSTAYELVMVRFARICQTPGCDVN